ncbi:hypothetical protein AB0M20_23410 [Actinoplanes sp. NPDC051633]|uniref:hypothetical protein n=1 Tax=Actinoplanes sp. NPDC051633 TaxID=3155670 RepID=UPI00343C71E3
MTSTVERVAAAVAVLLALAATVLAVVLLDVRYLVVPAGAAALGLLGRRRAVIVGLTCVGGLVSGLFVWLVVQVLFLPANTPAPYSLPRISVHYTGRVDATGPAVTLTETVVCDRDFRDNLEDEFTDPEPDLSALRMPAGWSAEGRLDGAPVYVRVRGLPAFGAGTFGVQRETFDLNLGAAALGSDQFWLVPVAGSDLTIRTPKGALGNSDPAADGIQDLPGRPALQSLSIKTPRFGGPVTIDVLGSALRNPAGRKIYEAGSWGFLPWLLSALVLALTAVAVDVLKERVRGIFTTTEEKPAPRKPRKPRRRRR